MAPTKELMRILAEIQAQHSNIPGIRHKGRIYVFVQGDNRHKLLGILKSNIPTVE